MRRIGRRGLQLRQQVLQIVGRVLAIEQDPVEAGSGDDLDRVVRRKARPQADLRPARLERALETVLRQVHQWISGSGTGEVPSRKSKSQPSSAWRTCWENTAP